MSDAPIGDFLFNIGWKVDEQSKRRMFDSILEMGKRISEMAIAFELGVRARAQVFDSLATSLDQLYWQANRTNSTVGEIKAMGEAAERVGGSADTMTRAITGFSQALRKLETSPGAANRMLREHNVPDPEHHTAGENLTALVHSLRSRYSYGVAAYRLQTFWGVPEAALYDIDHPEFQKRLKEAEERSRLYGVDPKDPNFGKKAAEFAAARGDVWGAVDAIQKSVTEQLGGRGGEALTKLADLLDANAKPIANFLVGFGQAMAELVNSIIELIKRKDEWWPQLEEAAKTIERWATGLGHAVGSTIGWKTALELLAIVMIGSRMGLAIMAITALAAAFMALLALFNIKPAVAAAGVGGSTGPGTPQPPSEAGGGAGGFFGRIRDAAGGLYARARGAAGVANRRGGGGGIADDYSAVGGGAGLKEVMDREAKRSGIDPRILYGIFAGEGKGGYVGDYGTSFGPYQLHYKSNVPGMRSAGLGNNFTRDTGLDASDPKTIAAQTRWVANFIARGGSLGHWHGYRGRLDWNPSWSRSRTAAAVPDSPKGTGLPTPAPAAEAPPAPVPPEKAKLFHPGSRFFDTHGPVIPNNTPVGVENTWRNSIKNSTTQQHLTIDVTGPADPEAVARHVTREVGRAHEHMINSTVNGAAGLPKGAKEKIAGHAPKGAPGNPGTAGPDKKTGKNMLPTMYVD